MVPLLAMPPEKLDIVDGTTRERLTADEVTGAGRRYPSAVRHAAGEGGNVPDNDAVLSRRDHAGIADAAAERPGVLHGDRGWVLPPLATILLLLSTLMPPETMPLSKIPPPLRKAPLMTEMPPAPIVPALVTPPLKVVWLITIPVVWPLKTVG